MDQGRLYQDACPISTLTVEEDREGTDECTEKRLLGASATRFAYRARRHGAARVMPSLREDEGPSGSPGSDRDSQRRATSRPSQLLTPLGRQSPSWRRPPARNARGCARGPLAWSACLF